MMTATELKEAMYRFANGKAEAYEQQLSLVDKDNKTEKKALTIQKNMAGHSAGFLQMDFDGRYYEVRENIVFRHQASHLFDEYRDAYEALDEEGKKLFLTFAYPMTMVMTFFYLPRKALLETETDAKKVFEAKIIVGTLGEILGEWQRLWNTCGSMKCEVFR